PHRASSAWSERRHVVSSEAFLPQEPLRPKDPDQQRRGTGELVVPETNHAPPVCYSAWFGAATPSSDLLVACPRDAAGVSAPLALHPVELRAAVVEGLVGVAALPPECV